MGKSDLTFSQEDLPIGGKNVTMVRVGGALREKPIERTLGCP
jgi:hypothetical protein